MTPQQRPACHQEHSEPLMTALKNSLFYRTEHGAFIGDMFMILITTCTLNQVNPSDSLIILLENSSALFKDPSRWEPWNYKANIV